MRFSNKAKSKTITCLILMITMLLTSASFFCVSTQEVMAADRKPSAPTKMRVSVSHTTTRCKMKVTWSKPKKNNSNIIGYEIQIKNKHDISDPLGIAPGTSFVEGKSKTYVMYRGKKDAKLCFRARACRRVKGKTYVGPWSSFTSYYTVKKQR